VGACAKECEWDAQLSKALISTEVKLAR
jgi:hypothetical protein